MRIAIVVCTLLPAAVIAQQAQQTPAQQTNVPPPRAFQLPPRVGVVTDMPLSLDEAIQRALTNNRDIEISRITQLQADFGVTSAEGVFDPRVETAASWQKAVTPVASALGGSATGAVTNRNLTVSPGFAGSTPMYGGSYAVDFNSQRSATNNSFTQLNPTYPTSLNFSYTQPLWRGLRYDDNRRRLEVAKKNRFLTDAQFKQRVMETVTRTEQAYWDLAYAYGNLAVQVDAVRLGREQDESNRRQEREGLLAPIDVVAAQRQVATFEQNALTAQEVLTSAENALKALIAGDRFDPLWSNALIPTTPVNVNPPVIPLADAIASAMAKRPEIEQLQIAGEINDADNRFFTEQRKPQIDLVASHSNSGLAGALLPAAPNPFTSGFAVITQKVNELSTIAGVPGIPDNGGGGGGNVLPPLLIGSYGQSLANLFGGNFPTTQVQLRLSLPLRNRTAEANLSSSIAEGRRIRTQRQLTEMAIEASVRNAMQSVTSARARLDSARVARSSAEEQYESEQRQFRAGTSTLFLVQQRQNDMIIARSQERLAEATLGKAVAAFELATGGILDEHNVELK